MDFDSISNQELIQALTERGVNVGGINATTRNLYLNKLKRLISEESGAVLTETHGGGDSQHNGTSNDEVHDHHETAPTVRKIHVVSESAPRQRKSKVTTPEPESDSDYGEESSRILSDEEMRLIREESFARRSPPRPPQTSVVARLIKLLILILVIVFIYFIVDNISNKSMGNREAL